jgi:hypothetical protein
MAWDESDKTMHILLNAAQFMRSPNKAVGRTKVNINLFISAFFLKNLGLRIDCKHLERKLLIAGNFAAFRDPFWTRKYGDNGGKQGYYEVQIESLRFSETIY